jgi:hypothetical protein
MRQNGRWLNVRRQGDNRLLVGDITADAFIRDRETASVGITIDRDHEQAKVLGFPYGWNEPVFGT